MKVKIRSKINDKNKIKEARKKNGLSQLELAEKLGYKSKTVEEIKRTLI
ncbi:MAG: helix-turn-helix domain-containing protein [Elusimicrobiota bacterium]|jgi:DNA-binding XRE family transcriptional regulator|nr:helix-turn-helix domain-containing protein [Elusimicrobiota bacterium]